MNILNNRIIDDYGQVIIFEEMLYDILLSDKSISGLIVEDNERMRQFNTLCKEWDHPNEVVEIYEPIETNLQQYHKERQSKWFIPDEFKNLDMKEYLLSKCKTQIEIDRVVDEMKLFEERDMIMMLRCLTYLVDHFRKNKIVWGVGRGSSVSSYCLYLIGIHKINSIKFNLDIKEFLK